MALGAHLKLKQSQSLVMTPQLQQAIKLLQLSNIELAAFVEEELQKNPLLERGTGDENRRGEQVASSDIAEPSSELKLDAPQAEASEALDMPDSRQFEDASPGELAQQGELPAAPSPSTGGEIDWSKSGPGGSFSISTDYDAASNAARELSLEDVLRQQLPMAFKDITDQRIADHLIDHVDENGYIRADLEDMASRLGTQITKLEEVLGIMQGFEPSGVMARSLQECLAIQLSEREELDQGMQVLIDNLPMLAKHDLPKLAKLCGVSKDGLTEMIAKLRSLAPKPGLAYGATVSAAIEPDVFVREQPGGGWGVELNSHTLPRVLINSRYYAEVCNLSDDEGVKTFMSECQANASWLIKSLDQRARTILKVATEIVRQQDEFFAYGINHLRPLNLKTIAEAIDMHESTVSRVTSNKYMATPRGNFELKYFFTAAIPSLGEGEAISAEAVRHKIRGLIAEETVKTVLSDDKIVDLLRAEGIDIARRTVAKYREAMGIQSSVERRRRLKHTA